MDFRVYYECLEQANHYVAPLLDQGARRTAGRIRPSITLVRSPPNGRGLAGGRLRTIFQFTTPDFLVSAADSRVEVPLLIGEFSESVSTEDHELQRAIGGVAGAISNTIYLKISGRKVSDREHGGNTNFEPLTVAHGMVERHAYASYFVADWATREGNDRLLSRNSEFLSCPEWGASPLAESILSELGAWAPKRWPAIGADPAGEFVRDHRGAPWMTDYLRRVQATPTVEQMFEDWASRASREGWQRVRVLPEELVVKVNRFSHSADPDRGVLMALSTLTDRPRVLARYAVKEADGPDRASVVRSFLAQAEQEGLAPKLLTAIRSALRDAYGQRVDLTPKIRELGASLYTNKVAFTLIYFSDGLLVHLKGHQESLRITWSRRALLGLEAGKLFSALRRKLDALELGPPVDLVSPDGLTEDEVTYILVHSVLQPNGFRVVSVSYPGAQGECAILAERARGRSQERIYVDVIASVPGIKLGNGGVSLHEVKESLYRTDTEKDVRKLLGIRGEPAKRRALAEALQRLGEPNPRFVVVGVTFGSSRGVRTSWEPNDVDFLVRVSDEGEWKVATFGHDLDDAFRTKAGRLEIPSRKVPTNLSFRAPLDS